MTRTSRAGAFWAFIFGIAFGAVLGAVLMHKYLTEYAAPAGPAASHDPAITPQVAEDSLARIMRDWNLTPEQIRERLNDAGQVIRREGTALGARVDEATLDARVVAMIKAKYTLDKDLSAWDISVSSQTGRVTLTGTVNQPDLVVRAVVIALDTSGVVEVKSALHVKTSAHPATPQPER